MLNRLNFPQRLLNKSGVVALLSGMVSGALFAPFNFTVLVFLFSLLLVLLERKDLKASFKIGWLFGFGQFVVGLYWVGIALTVEIDRFWWLFPFAVLGLPALLGLYTGGVAALYTSLRMPHILKPLWFAALWTGGEYLRGTLFTGFPWNLTAYSWMTSEVGSVSYVAQSMSWVGAYGLSFLTVFLGASLFPLLEGSQKRRGVRIPLVLALALFLALAGYGFWRSKEGLQETPKGPLLRIVQPNIEQKLKWNRAQSYEILDKTLRLSLETPSASEKPSFIIWPESATQFYYDADQGMRELLARQAPRNGAFLMGAVRFVRNAEEGFKVWNSFYAVTDRGEIEGLYDKAHLVPFGEYIPFRSVVPKLIRKVTAGAVDYSSGTGVQTVTVSGVPPLSPLICFEGIFPSQVVAKEALRPRWMLNLTNDGWYGESSGPYQHLQSIQARAIEEGLPVVRAANSGVSALIDSKGMILKSLPLNEAGVLDFHLPSFEKETPPFGFYGNKIPLFLILISLLSCLGVAYRCRERKPSLASV